LNWSPAAKLRQVLCLCSNVPHYTTSKIAASSLNAVKEQTTLWLLQL
jgi:hypothetical protein